MTGFIFSTGTARGGTGLLTQALGAHPDVSIALDAYLPLFKSLRRAAVAGAGSPAVRAAFDANTPFQDYYFDDTRIATLDCVMSASLDLPFDARERDSLLAALYQRTPLEAADLVPYLPRLTGSSYRALWERALDIVAEARGKTGRRWTGMHENWAIEFFPPLARAFPEARFIVFLRDPRAVVASHRMVKDPAMQAHLLSYARHLRKYAACALRYEADPLFAGRLLVLRYEDLVQDPPGRISALCAWLGIDYDARMLDPEQHLDRATGQVWNGLSSYEPVARGFNPARIDRWRQHLPGALVKLVDYVCGPEMACWDYEPASPVDWPDAELLQAVREDGAGPKNWRTDFGVPEVDLGCEVVRRALLQMPQAADAAMIRRNFLFPEVFERLAQPAGAL